MTERESQVRQNFHKECEDGINKQINMELYASYVYLSMAYYFDRDDIALPGLHAYFKKSSNEEREHAMKLMLYLNKRGGRIVLSSIHAPERNEWGTAEDAMMAALELEKAVNQSLLILHKVATSHEDANLCDFLETEYLQEQVDSMKEIGNHLTNIRRVGEGLGIFMFDKELE
ncbi:soma ferritin [Anabrus simplex]|uniref:soma ferritin n=1 Tax=Anabrus simplex TaxID=316456 RepID=UPI0034DCD037